MNLIIHTILYLLFPSIRSHVVCGDNSMSVNIFECRNWDPNTQRNHKIG